MYLHFISKAQKGYILIVLRGNWFVCLFVCILQRANSFMNKITSIGADFFILYEAGKEFF